MENDVLSPLPLGEEDDEKPILIPATTSKRLLAELADIFLAFILGLTFYNIAALPMFGYDRDTTAINNLAQKLVAEEVSSHLLYVDATNGSYSASKMANKWIQNYYYGNTISDGVNSDFLYDYYALYRKEGTYDVKWYNVNILGLPSDLTSVNSSSFFVYDTSLADPLSSLGILNDSTHNYLKDYYAASQVAEVTKTYQNLASFFNTAYKSAFDEFKKSEPFAGMSNEVAALFSRRATNATAASFVSYFFSALLIFVGVPLIKFKGTTIGKKVLKINVLHEDGSSLKWWEIVSRGLVENVEFLFEVTVQGLLTFGFDCFTLPLISSASFNLPLSVLFVAGCLLTLASMLVMIFSKKHQSFHDYASRSFVFTSDYAIIAQERAKREKMRNDGKSSDRDE